MSATADVEQPVARRRRAADIVAPGDDMETRRAKFLDYYRRLAVGRGGECLSSEYVSAHERLSWRCADGHTWAATANSVRHGSWCNACAKGTRQIGRKADTFEQVKAIARLRGGRCLSTDYVDSQTHLSWRCRKGHVWAAVPASIIQGRWCAVCAGVKKLDMTAMHADAAARGGKCLSSEYGSLREPLLWECAEGHQWRARPGNIRSGKWCPHCAGKAPLTLEILQADAAEHGGLCLSTRYVDVMTKHAWQCRVGHVFRATPNQVRNGGWCPRCRGTTPDTLARMRDIARRRGGRCLSSEYRGSTEALQWRCRKGHAWEAPPNRIVSGAWCRECAFAESVGRRRRLTLADMQELARQRGGECLSVAFDTVTDRLLWRCHSGHEWRAVAGQVKHKSWCPVCAKKFRGTLDGMRALAAERGGRCLSDHYEGRTELELECARGHRFRASGRALKTGVWCSTCTPARSPRRRRSAVTG